MSWLPAINWPTKLVHADSGAVRVLLYATLENGRQLLAVLQIVCLRSPVLVSVDAESIGVRGDGVRIIRALRLIEGLIDT
jgi:hypothetical protein